MRIEVKENKYQEFRREVLMNLGIVLTMVLGNKKISWCFNPENYSGHEPKHATAEEYKNNMIEKEILEVYQHLVFGGMKMMVAGEVKIIQDEKYMLTTENINDNINSETKTTTKQKQRMDEEMITINKQQLTNRLKKLGAQLIEEKTIKEKEKIVEELFPNAQEVDIDNNTIHLYIGEEYIGAPPTRKQMLEVHEDFGVINRVYGLTIYARVAKNEVQLESNVAVDYMDKWGNGEFTDITIKEVSVEIPMTNKKATNTITNSFKEYEEGLRALDSVRRELDELSRCELAQPVKELIKDMEKFYNEEFEKKREANENKTTIEYFERVEKILSEGTRTKEEAIEVLSKKMKNVMYDSTKELYAKKIKELQSPVEVVLPTTKNKEEETFMDTYGVETTAGVTEYGDSFYSDMVTVDGDFFAKAEKLLGKKDSVMFYDRVKISKHPQFGIKIAYKTQFENWGECYSFASSLLRYAYDIICVKYEKKQPEEKELFEGYKLGEYINPETNNLCIDTGSMVYKKINGVVTQKWIDKFLKENPEYDMKLHNEKWIAVPHYVVYKKRRK
ncbi:MAG: hypothetical protein ACRCX2_20065 [Paraclostridium sp.]